ncbi:MAG TPA: histidinol phosphate phosphatase domain-containing protein [Methanomicrobia archaeon]|nr:histidinol phosphate phosphatase domain-containing protein [Methanomicrobia archaeon]
MFDLHTHSLFSDGALVPSELVRRAIVQGYEAIAITDHVDFTNIEFVLSNLKKAEPADLTDRAITVIRGVELTHIPPGKLEKLALKAKALGAELVVVHGETLAEPVARGTNRAAVNIPAVDILAHPGLITDEDAARAKENGIYLELTSRKGHCLANGHVAAVARRVGADMLLNTDTHAPEDLITDELGARILAGAGLTPEAVMTVMEKNPRTVLQHLMQGGLQHV